MFNYYFDADREGHDDVVRLFEAIKSGVYDGYASIYVTGELKQASEPKRGDMLSLIDKYNIAMLEPTPSVERLADLYIESGIVPASYYYDSAHIAVASVHEIDFVISYNFKHINRDKAKVQTTIINHNEGYYGVIICTAKEVLENERREV